MARARELSHKTCVFLLTFFSYAFFHANRKAFSNVKDSTGRVWTPTPNNEVKPDSLWNDHDMIDNHDDVLKYQGYLDTGFMVAYAIGLFINGYIGDRVNMRWLLSIGMGSTSILIFTFGYICEMYTFYNKYFYMTIWVVNGLMQSTGWPVVVACMGNWFGHGNRGLLLGIWSSCASVGNIIGALLVSSVLSYGYQYSFLVTSCVLFSGTLFAFFGLIPSPRDVGLEEPEEPESPENRNRQHRQVSSAENDKDQKKAVVFTVSAPANGVNNTFELSEKVHPSPLLDGSEDDEIVEDEVIYEVEASRPTLSFIQAVLLPGVIPYSLAYAFLKLVNYSFFFWLPVYLHNAFGWAESVSDQLSTIYDFAGIVGGTISGFISDRAGKRSLIVVPMLLLSIPALFIYSHSPNSKLINSVYMSVIGFFIGGAANLISAAIAADLGCQKALSGDDRALSTVTGVIDGTGSFGAAVGQIAVPYLRVGLGWHSVFYMFMISLFLTAVCLIPLFVKDVMSIKWRQLWTRCCLCTRSHQGNYTTQAVSSVNQDSD